MFISDCRMFKFVKFSLFVLIFISLFCTVVENMSSSEKLISLDFEVFGKVQGVFFRKYTEKEANRLGVRGWCMNTDENTVKGVLEGSLVNVEQMKRWLQKTGSPASRIDRAVFTNGKDINRHTYDAFRIKR